MNKETFDRQVQLHLNRREFAQAENLIESQLQASPRNADALYFSGVSAYFRGNIAKTIENLQAALQANPRHTDAAVCLSVLLNDLGKYDQAKQIFDQANLSLGSGGASDRQSLLGTSQDSEIDRKFSIKHIEIADLYFRYRRYDEAIDEYQKAIRLNPTDLDIQVRRARALSKKGFFIRAIQELRSLKSEHPAYLAGRIELGMMLLHQNQVLEAELEWEEILLIDPNHAQAKACLALAKQRRL